MANEPVTLLEPARQRNPRTGFSLAFLTNGAYSPSAPGGSAQGHRDVIELFRIAEQLGYGRGWVRNRHFDNYLSSPLTVIAAAGQHTSRIRLGTAIIPVGYEHPIRVAEDAATVDLLVDGRLELGIATGIPGFDPIFGAADARPFKESAADKVDRLLEALAGTVLGYAPAGTPGPATVADPAEGRVFGPAGEHAPGRGTPYYTRPYVPGLRDRIWYGPGGVDSAAHAASQGLDLLLSAIGPNIGLGFEGGQRAQIDAHREAWTRTDRAPRVSAHRLFFPFVNDGQRALYRAYADLRDREGAAASRPAGSLPPRAVESRNDAPAPSGARGPGLQSPVVVGEPDEIVEYLRSDVAVQAADELGIFLPPGFSHRENLELIENIAELVAKPLGWDPAAA
ncbi:LLM class flavin-dependent oxidoreductase [Galbitalea sp. SE-J8]|uniref:LLM class flavin-dependent oxidoreductase n=1 Tax=Galbitalea sp. SE-J8 TaxID=3054952 RepID=UPI00259CAFEC|nr:LLM class flavin-dependent oxidoreductase [Galbitalea sp. SE-J8]MDM4761589.1 LLM class flavin-dependent oxidoreductase [Galbitalea sp. SE-J8]